MGAYYEVPAGDSADDYHLAVERAGVIELPDDSAARLADLLDGRPEDDRQPGAPR